jgi:D-alanyl-D-alanine dipeptidase
MKKKSIVCLVLGSMAMNASGKVSIKDQFKEGIDKIKGKMGESEFKLVDISKVNSDIVIDMRYATENNFTNTVVYGDNVCYALPNVAAKLSNVQKALEEKGLGLKVYDCFRPKSAQQKFWDLVPDEKYVSNPAKGSRHTRGTTVDVTLVDKDGNELEMPSEFDDFTEKAHRTYKDCSEKAKENSQLLEDLMVKEGFEPLPTEWWHFDLEGWRDYSEIDYEF